MCYKNNAFIHAVAGAPVILLISLMRTHNCYGSFLVRVILCFERGLNLSSLLLGQDIIVYIYIDIDSIIKQVRFDISIDGDVHVCIALNDPRHEQQTLIHQIRTFTSVYSAHIDCSLCK